MANSLEITELFDNNPFFATGLCELGQNRPLLGNRYTEILSQGVARHKSAV